MGHWRKQMISFFVTSRCNLACTYCYMPKLDERVDPSDKVIDVRFAQKGMEDFFAWSTSRRIRFFSAGEPTMEFEILREIYAAALSLAGDELEVEIQTNGYFGDEVAQWIAQHCDTIWISIDGCPAVQDVQRPTIDGHGSARLVLSNLCWLLGEAKGTVGVRATVLPSGFHKQKDMIDYWHSLGVRYVCGAPSYNSDVNEAIERPRLIDFARHFAEAHRHAAELGIFYQTHLMVNFDEAVPAYCRSCTTPPCPHLTTDGYVSCCDWASFGARYLPGPLQQCIYGKWDNRKGEIVYWPDRQERIEDRSTTKLANSACKGCSIVEHCAGGCIGKVMANSGDLHRIDPNWCAAVKYLAEEVGTVNRLFPIYHS